jgi:hypothetical protein
MMAKLSLIGRPIANVPPAKAREVPIRSYVR